MSDPIQEFPPPPPPSPVQETPERKRPPYMLIAGVILFILGIGIVLGGVAKIIPGGIGTGASVGALGVLLFALSFARLPAVPPDAPPPMSVFERLAGIFYEPTRVFQNLRFHPRWVVALLIISIFNAVYIAAFVQRLTPERIVNYTMDKLEESPLKPPPDRMATMRDEALEQAKSPAFRVGGAVRSIVGTFFFVAFVAALYLLGVLAFGGRMHFWQSLAVAVYAAFPVVVIQKVVSFVILYLKSPDDIHPLMGQETLVQDNLGILFAPKDHPVLFVAASAIGILSFYKLWLTAKGLHYGGDRVSSSAAWGAAITIWVLGLLFLVAIAAIFPSFIS